MDTSLGTQLYLEIKISKNLIQKYRTLYMLDSKILDSKIHDIEILDTEILYT